MDRDLRSLDKLRLQQEPDTYKNEKVKYIF